MVQSWVASYHFLEDVALIDHVLNFPGWFVSCLALYWLFEALALKLAAKACAQAERSSGPGAIPWLAIAVIYAWALFWPWGPTAVVYFGCYIISHGCGLGLLHWNVLSQQYAHQYFAGALFACWIHARAAAGCAPIRYATSASLAAFAIVIGVGDLMQISALSANWIQAAGLLLPAWCGMLLGLVEGIDPLANLLGRAPARVNTACELSLALYIFQKPIIYLCENIERAILPLLAEEAGGRKHFLGVALPRGPADAICSNWAEFFLLFIPLLVVASASVHFGVQKPIASRLSRYIGK